MDISKLTIQGFKSFYEKSTFSFGKNITGIVGPNGSGKSNITEAIRFVLGEQSTKSMRGKDATDLLFRGNSVRATKAKVEVEFEKSKYTKSVTPRGNIENIFVKNALEKDIVTVSRTIYQDGKSEYQMNGVEVRLKDLHEFLLYIHLGNKSSWHISQGEADRVLTANSFERKAIIEDALGLKVYHARINDSLKKLEKTKENIREATLKRKELIPELNVLQKTVERIKRGDEYRGELTAKGNIYLGIKHNKIQDLKNGNNVSNVEKLKSELVTIEKKIVEKEKNLYKEGVHDMGFLDEELSKEEKVFNHLQNEWRTLDNSVRSLQNNLDYSLIEEKRNKTELENIEKEIKEINSAGNDIIFSELDVNTTKKSLEDKAKTINLSNDVSLIKNLSQEQVLEFSKFVTHGSVVNKDNVKQISYLQGIKTRLQEKVKSLKEEKEKLENEISSLKPNLESLNLKIKLSNERREEINKQILEFKYKKVEAEAETQKLIYERNNLELQIGKAEEHEERVDELNHEFENELSEFKSILGNSFKISDDKNTNMSEEEFLSLKRNIERLKVRLEESSVVNADEIIKNYEDMTERDAFLLKEIADLESSMQNLTNLINDLKENLAKEFELGLKHIDKVFDSYVKKLFGGGMGKVFLMEYEKKVKKGDDLEEDNESEDEEVKTGVEVEVEIPKKKIKGLQSLSGGERALVSIALNFSIIHQNPAPFMILDETDATLDEANAKRYGEILSILKEQTKLIVVTHNRETMHFTDQVYGITLSKEGHSKVLSVSFEDAIEYAK